MVTVADATGVVIVTGCKKRTTSFALVASSVVLYGNWSKTAGVCLVLWCPIGACVAPIGSNFGSKSDEVCEKESHRREAAIVARLDPAQARASRSIRCEGQPRARAISVQLFASVAQHVAGMIRTPGDEHPC